MSRRKVLYTDLPHEYDRDASRLIKAVGFVMASCLLLAVLAIALSGG